jgi:hypothetical protein
MARFEAIVRLLDVDETDEWAARRAVEERLRAGGFPRWQVIRLGPRGSTRPGRRPRPPGPRPQADLSAAGGGLMLSGVVAWILWFLWVFGGN